jgi:hypothetical protein
MLTLKEGESTRELNNDWYTGGKTLFEVEMSYTQFAELISAMNVGNGIPVTIRYTADKGQIEGIDIKNKRTQFLDEFKAKNNDSAENIKNIINTLTAIFNEKKPIKAADRKEILSALNRLYNDVTSHNDFILNQFNESMEHITTEAKGEVEAFVQNKMNSIALAALKAELPSDFTPDNPILISESNE